ncbi:unnamed protein product [Linum trigynum]|uniref:Retrotransposon gag domain-containing protein n=1 Tax=Linum trigynum TaxID=586398 RepID=A0AAV2CJ51_9ROSI
MPQAAWRGQPRIHDKEESDDGDYPREEDNDMRGSKVTIPSFKGTKNLDAYFNWERKMKLIFDCHNYSEKKKVHLATLEFSDYGMVWWDNLCMRRNRQRLIETWKDMQGIMMDRFVPNYHRREVNQTLQLLQQGTKSVEDYY